MGSATSIGVGWSVVDGLVEGFSSLLGGASSSLLSSSGEGGSDPRVPLPVSCPEITPSGSSFELPSSSPEDSISRSALPLVGTGASDSAGSTRGLETTLRSVPSPSSSASLEESELSDSSRTTSLTLSRTSTRALADATGRARRPRMTTKRRPRSASRPRRS